MPYLAYPRCFLSGSFDEADKDFFRWIEKLLRALEFEVVTGEDAEPRPPLETIHARIQSSTTLLGILSKRDRIDGTEKWKPPQWVADEIAMAFALGKPVAVLVEDGVEVEGLVPAATTYVPVNRDKLMESTPTIVHYLVNLRNKVSPPLQLEGDIPSARILSLELSVAASELEKVNETLELDSSGQANLTAILSGRLLTLPQLLLQDVEQAYGALKSVGKTLNEIEEARENLRPKSEGLTWPRPPAPALPSDHPLIKRLRTEQEPALLKVRRAGLLLYRFGWPVEWKTIYPALSSIAEPAKFKEMFGIDPTELV